MNGPGGGVHQKEAVVKLRSPKSVPSSRLMGRCRANTGPWDLCLTPLGYFF